MVFETHLGKYTLYKRGKKPEAKKKKKDKKSTKGQKHIRKHKCYGNKNTWALPWKKVP